MKKLIILLSLTAAFFLQSCEKKGPGDNYDFSNSLPPYAEISAKTNLSVVEGNNATIAVRLRTAIQQEVLVNYSVTGAFSTTGTITIPREALTASVAIPVPPTLVPAGSSSVTAVFKITGAATKSGEALTIGSLGEKSNEVRNIVVVKNLISFSSDELEIAETLADQTIKVPISISSALKAAASVSYTVAPIAGNTAANLQVVSANPLVIPAGATTAFIEIKVKDNLTLDENNVYEVKLTGATAPVGAEVSIDDSKALYTITVIDDFKLIGFTSGTGADVIAPGNKNLEVKLSSASSASISVPYTITGGIPGVDYILRTTGVLTFAPGTTISNINLDIPATYGKGKVLKIKLETPTGDAEASLGAAKEYTLNLK